MDPATPTGAEPPPKRPRQEQAAEAASASAAAPSSPPPAASVRELDSLPGFAPPPPAAACPPELEEQLQQYFKKMNETQETVADQLRSRQDFAHPDMLASIVRKYEIDQFATFLDKSVWSLPGDDNPNGLCAADYYDEIVKSQSACGGGRGMTDGTPLTPLAPGQPSTPVAATVARKSGVAATPPPLPHGAGAAPYSAVTGHPQAALQAAQQQALARQQLIAQQLHAQRVALGLAPK
eukprot:TRINITY_DN6139_c0_g1_i1.p1 TRINITY_DN6139_c0_g1~~TRINITY_DN6139_c0_g1_i1.p1  ORF type:complete len:271 (+),score=86.81 TRINITY_DN6139_c0_g1_i1:103-813(+)